MQSCRSTTLSTGGMQMSLQPRYQGKQVVVSFLNLFISFVYTPTPTQSLTKRPVPRKFVSHSRFEGETKNKCVQLLVYSHFVSNQPPSIVADDGISERCGSLLISYFFTLSTKTGAG